MIGDQVQGRVVWQNENLDDLVLLRGDGNPTYMLAVVVDDHDMGVTHVIRGDDHLITSALEWRTRASDDRQDSSGTRAGTSRAQTSEQQKVFWIQHPK